MPPRHQVQKKVIVCGNGKFPLIFSLEVQFSFLFFVEVENLKAVSFPFFFCAFPLLPS